LRRGFRSQAVQVVTSFRDCSARAVRSLRHPISGVIGIADGALVRGHAAVDNRVVPDKLEPVQRVIRQAGDLALTVG